MANTLLSTVENENLMNYIDYDGESQLYLEPSDIKGPKELVNSEWRSLDCSNLFAGGQNVITINNTCNFVRNFYLHGKVKLTIEPGKTPETHHFGYRFFEYITWRIGDNTDHRNYFFTNFYSAFNNIKNGNISDTLKEYGTILGKTHQQGTMFFEDSGTFEPETTTNDPQADTIQTWSFSIPITIIPAGQYWKGSKNKPIPLHLLKNPLEIELKINNNLKTLCTDCKDIEISKLTLHFESIHTFPSFKKSSSDKYIYKYLDWYDGIYRFTYSSPQTTEIVIHGIKPGECTEIIFAVVPVDALKPYSLVSTFATDIKLRYQGVELFNSETKNIIGMQNILKGYSTISESANYTPLFYRIPISHTPNSFYESYSTGANFKAGDLVLSFLTTSTAFMVYVCASVHAFLAFQNYVVQGSH